jgi:hypothetical protein
VLYHQARWALSSYIQPTLTVTTTQYIYQTSFGTYVFSKALPFVLVNYTAGAGGQLISASTYLVNTSVVLLSSVLTVLLTNSTFYQVKTPCMQLLTTMGYITQTWQFATDNCQTQRSF